MLHIFKYFLVFTLFFSSLLAEEKISLQLLWKHQFEFAGFYIAKEKGFYKKEGLDVDIKEYSFGIDIVEDVLQGKSDIGIGRSSLVLDKLRSKKIVLLNALFQDSPYVLISKQRPDLKNLHDFKDKKIMLSDKKSSAAIVSMMKIQEITEKDYTAVAHTFNISDLLEDNTDLISVYLSNEPYELHQKNISYTIFDPKDMGIHFYADLLFCSEQYLNGNEEKIQKFQNATLKGWRYAFENIDESVEIILQKYNSQNKSKASLIYEAEALKPLAYTQDIELGSIDELRIKEIANVYRLLGFSNASNKNLENLIYKPKTLMETIFSWQLFFGLLSLILIGIFLVISKQYILKRQNKLLQSIIEEKTNKLFKYTKELESQKELHELVFDNSSHGVLFIDLQSKKFVDCNQQAFEMLGASSKDQLLHQTPASISPEFQDDGIRSDLKSNEMINKVIDNGKARFEWKHLKFNGEELYVEVNLTFILLSTRAIIYTTWKDIDKEVHAKKDLQSSQKELQKLNENLEKMVQKRTQDLEYAIRAKSDFLANMSHEIRTPLNGIIGFIDILHKNESDKEKVKKLTIIKESSNSLLTIINDILDYSKIESNKIIIEKAPINLYEIFHHIVELFFSKASEKNIEIILKIDENVPKSALGDSTRIKQVLSNLLSNAIKFSHENTNILIDLHYKQELQMLFCSVRDYGTGISSENLQNIFKSFEQADSSVTRTYGGTGLGLTISKSLVELMKGTIHVKSKLGYGSTFSFNITLQEIKHELITTNSQDLCNEQLKGNILIVEDNKTNQMLLSMLLDDLKLTSEIANDGLEAIEMVKSNHYDLILMDENMPKMNGRAATKILRATKKAQEIPIIAVTANALKGDKEEFLQAGMDDYIAKPINNDELISVLRKYL